MGDVALQHFLLVLGNESGGVRDRYFSSSYAGRSR